MITFETMVRMLSKQGNDIAQSLTPTKAAVWHHSSCLMGEAGELLDGQLDLTNVVEELGDLEFYIEGLRDALDIPHNSVVDDSILMAYADVCKLDYINGIVVESCNVFDACKKWIIYEQDLNIAKLFEAMRRWEYYMTCFRGSQNLRREDVLKANMFKLAKRYGASYQYTNAAAKARADKQS